MTNATNESTNKVEMTKTSLTLRRIINATPEEAYDAWADSSKFQSWFMGRIRDWSYQQDVQVGGKFEIVMKHEGEDLPHTGEYRILDRPNTIQFTWSSKNTNEKETLVTINFHKHGNGTELILTHEQLPEEWVEPHTQGWTMFVGKMEAWLEA